MDVRFFIALLPPLPRQAQIRDLQQDLSDRFGSQAALRSPPHITLHAPFTWPMEQISGLTAAIADFARQHAPLTIVCQDFGAFPPRVIFIAIQQSEGLMQLQASLATHMQSVLCQPPDRRPFHPHMTLIFRDFKPAQFHQAWPEFQRRSLEFDFDAQQLTLLRHDGQRWQTYQAFVLGDTSSTL